MFIEDWIIGLRTPFLHPFFAAFRFLASDFFFISFLCIGYWSFPRLKNWKSLAFLIAYTALVNCTLKNLFGVIRPDQVPHLVDVKDPFGFPSGDMQLVTIFWSYWLLRLSSPTFWLWGLSSFSILGVGISRIYLGVHTIFDVMGGFFFSLLLLFCWHHYLEAQFFKKGALRYWFFSLVSILAYGISSLSLPFYPMVTRAIGIIIGLGLANWHIREEKQPLLPIRLPKAVVYLLLLLLAVYFFPSYGKDSKWLYHLLLMVRYLMLTFSVIYLVPFLGNQRLFR